MSRFDEDTLESLAPSYQRWDTSEGNVVSVTETDNTVHDVLNSISEDLQDFKFHCFIKWKQHDAFKDSCTNSTPNRVVVQVDYAENFTCCVQDEIAQFHFKGGTQVMTLFFMRRIIY